MPASNAYSTRERFFMNSRSDSETSTNDCIDIATIFGNKKLYIHVQ